VVYVSVCLCVYLSVCLSSRPPPPPPPFRCLCVRVLGAGAMRVMSSFYLFIYLLSFFYLFISNLFIWAGAILCALVQLQAVRTFIKYVIG
jgi:hypothetical protein